MEELFDIYHQNIPEPILEFAKVTAMERLKDIGMNCGCQYTSFPVFKNIKEYSRYQHSIGVALISYHFSLDLKQAIAGLYHDIASPVFAHVIDFLKGDYENQEATEDGTSEIIVNSSDIQKLLNKYDLENETISDYHLYPICDNDSPKLSADRLEYTLGNIVNFGFGDKALVQKFYADLTVGINEFNETEIMFKSESIANEFTEIMMKCSRIYVCDADRYSMESLALIIKEAIKDKILTYRDLYTTESEVINKLKADSRYKILWENYCANKQTYKCADGLFIKAKKRYIDPFVVNKGRISCLNAKLAKEMADFKAISFDYGLKGE